MPKNKGKGGKNRRRGKNENDDVKRELTLKELGQSYAQVTRILGNGHLEAFCFDNAGGKKRLCHIRGKLRKKQWINQGDVILVGLRDYQDDKADVIMKYLGKSAMTSSVVSTQRWFPLADEARELKRLHEIPENTNIIDAPTADNDDSNVVFDDKYNNEDSEDDDIALPRFNGNRRVIQDSLSDANSENDDDEQEDEHYNPNRLPQKSGNLNAGNLLGTKKESGKGARNDRRQVISGSESEGDDALAHI